MERKSNLKLNKKPRILHIVSSLKPGGLENGVVNIVNNLSDFEHIIVCLREKGDFAKHIQRNVKIISLDIKSGSTYKYYPKLLHIFKTFSPDLIHVRNWSAIDGIIIGKLYRSSKLVYSEHGYEISDLKKIPFKKKVLKYLVLKSMPNQIVAVCKFVAHYLWQVYKVNPKLIKIIYNGVDTKKFKPINNKIKNNKNFIIGSVGRLDPIKNHIILIELINKLKKIDFIKLEIIGDGPYRMNLENLINEYKLYNKVSLLGYKTKIYNYYPRFSVFVLPSLLEGLSNTLLEAMSCGIPVIASNVGGNPEILQGKLSKYLFEPNDLQKLVSLISYLIKHPIDCLELGQYARNFILKNFSLEKMLTGYNQLYLELI